MSQRGRQFKISKSAQIILAIIVFGLFFMSQKAQAVLYDPGQTLNPQCLPTDANCDVRPAVSAPTNAAAGSLLYASATSTYAALSIGANGQILKVANGALSWSDDSAYAILNGRVGGQTMIGGTTANSPLVLQANSAASGNTPTLPGLEFNVGNSGATTALTILNNGNVGIGTTNPTATLAINGNIAMTGSIIPTSNITYSLGSPTNYWKDVYIGPGSLYVNGQKVLQTDSNQDVNITADLNQSLVLKTYGTGDIELNPTLSGQILLKGDLRLSTDKKFVGGAALDNVTVSGNSIAANNLNGGLSLAAAGTGDVYVTNGNFGVGTTSPAEKLDVAGNLRFSGALMPNGQAGQSGQFLISQGTGLAPQWTTSFNPSAINLSSGQILVGNVSGQAAAVTLNGDATLDTNGFLSLATTTVTSGTFGASGVNIPTFTVDAKGRLTAAGNRQITSTDLGLGNVENTALSTWSGTSNINTVGTITSGVWNGGVIDTAHGGTGQTNATSAINALLPSQSVSAGKFLTSDGLNISWANVPTPTWGNIAGTLASQTDLQAALNGKQTVGNYVTGTPWTTYGYVTGTPWTSWGYITSSALSPYLTSSLASSTYQPIGTYLTSNSGNWVGSWQGYNSSDFLASSTAYQAPLTSGTNIKTINSASLLGNGNISLPTLANFSASGPISYSSSTGAFAWTNPGYILGANNLSDLASSTLARASLGLGTAATYNFSDFLASSTAYVANNSGNWAGTWQNYSPASFAPSSTVSSQWTATSSNLYYNSGSVGIGTTNPTSPDSTTFTPLLAVQATTGFSGIVSKSNASNGGGFFVEGNDTNHYLTFGTYGSSYGSSLFGVTRSNNSFMFTGSGGALGIGTLGSQNLTLGTNNTANITVQSGGNVGLGTTNPVSLLTLAGGSLITPSIDSTSAIGFASNAATTTPIFSVDTTNNRIGINNSSPTQALDIGYGNLNFKQLSGAAFTPPTPALAGLGAGNLSNGTYYYQIIMVTPYGETGYENQVPTAVTVVDKTINGKVQLTNIPVGLAGQGVIARKIYRTQVNGAYYFSYYLATINDNTSTTYLDNNADSALNTSLGYYLKSNTTAGKILLGGSNLFVSTSNSLFSGAGAGGAVTTGVNNTMLGINAGSAVNTGSYGVYIGKSAGANVTTGAANVVIGGSAMGHSASGGASSDVAIGYNAGDLSTGNNNMFLGAAAGAYETTNSNRIIFDTLDRSNQANQAAQALFYGVTNASSSSQTLQLGGGGIVNMMGSLGIGTTAPTYSLDVQGTTAISGINSQAGYNINIVAAPPSPTYTLNAGGNVDVGVHYYFVTYTTAIGETNTGSTLTATTTSGNQTVNLTIPTSTDPRVTGRKIYRTKAGTTNDSQYYLATIADNTTTTYTDTIADASLTGAIFQHYRVNTTSKYISVAGTQGMVIDNNLTALGVGAGAQFIGTNNYPSIRTVLIGFNAGKSITTGSANVIVGVAGGSLTTGGNNTLVGDLAGNANVSGNYNTVMGPQAARFLLTSNNIMIGANAGDFLNDGSTHLTSPTNSIYLGFNAHGYSDTETNAIVIGNNALGLGSNTTVIGNSYTTTTALFGNVGIGTTNPLTALDIRGNTSVGVANTGYTSTFWNSNNGSSRTHFAIDGTSNDTILKFLDNSNNITGQWFTGTASMLFSAANSRSLTFETVGAYPMTFYTNSTGIGTMNNPRMTLDSSGNVGIGTTNPGKALDVIGEIRSSSAITSLGGGIFDNGGSGVFSSSNAVVNWGNINSGVNSALAFYTKNAEAMRIDPSGKVGIGNSSPTYKLDVMGTSTTDGIRTNIALDFYQVPPPPAPTLALVSGGSNLGIGTYYYEVIYTTALGQTEYSQTTASITTDSGDRKVLITVPVSNDARVTGRKIYRTTVGDAWYNAKLLTTIADNTTTSYTDDKTDASLGASIFYGSPNTTNNFITVTGLYAGVAGTYKALNLQPSNTTVGMLAGRYLGITSGNVLIGELAGGYDNLTGTSNTMVGESAGGSLNTGSQNTGIGYNSLTKLTGGQRNFAGGWNSLGSLTTGNYNTAIGTNAGYGITGTNYGIFLGNYAGKYETNANTLIIDSLDRSNQANSENNALIYGVSSATPSSQILSLGGGGKVGVGTIAPNYKFEVQGSTATDAIRSWSGYDIYEVPIPTVPTGVVSSGGSVDTGGHYYSVTYVTALGQTQGAVSALITTTAGNNTVTLTIPTSTDPRVIGRKIGRTKAGGGASSDYLLATINDNATTTYVDTAADSSLTTQQYATYIPNTTSKQITINGTRAMALDANLTAVGFNSGTSITNGFWNTFLGVNAGAAVSSGFGNTLFGWQAGRAIATGGDNVGIGTGPLSSMSSGSYNIGIGRNVGYYTNGSGNLFIGENSGFTTTGSYNIFLGYYSGNYETGSNKIIIDNLDRSNLANGESQALIYGVTNTTPASQILSLGGGGNVGINNISPHYSLDVSGTGNFSNTLNAAGGLSVTGTSTFNGLGTGAVYSSSGRLTNTDPSDINLKTNVADIGNSLSKIMQLRPVTFDWKDGGQVSQGFIAQEVETVIPELVGTVPGGYKGLYTTRFIPYIVKSIQEQQAEINSLLGGPSLSLSALNNLVLSGGLKVSGHVSFDADTVGEATVSAGQTEVIVNFSADYLEKPMITATPEADTQGAYWVSDVTAQSFKIKLHQAQANDVAFFWHAFAKKDDLLATTTPAIINGGSSLDNLGQDNQATTTSPADNSASTTSAAASSSTSTPVSSDASSVSGGTDASAVVPAVPAPAADSSISAPDSSAPASDASSSN